MKTPKEILDDLFKTVRAQEPSKLKNIGEEAKFLNMSVGHLSRLKNQRVVLTDDAINRIVLAFTPYLIDETHQQRLKRELTLSREASTITSTTTAPKEVFVAQGAVKDF